MKEKFKNLVTKFKDNLINVAIGFATIIVTAGILSIVKVNYEFPGFDFISDVLSFGILVLGSHQLGKFFRK